MFYHFSTIQKGSLLMDCSTIDPSVSQAMAELAAGKGASFVDAPVSGGNIFILVKQTKNYKFALSVGFF